MRRETQAASNMPPAQLEEQALFQLNLLLWAAMPAPREAAIRPVLHDKGYVIFSIEQRLTPSLTEQTRLTAKSPAIRIAPVADLMLFHNQRDHYVIVECKRSSFSASSSAAEQARGFIAAGGDIARRGLGITSGSAEVTYLLPSDSQALQRETLRQCCEQVKSSDIPACTISVLGIDVRGDGVYLIGDSSAGEQSLSADIAPEARIRRLDEGEDPRSLYLIPWIPGSEDQDLDVLGQKLWAAILAHLGASRLGITELTYAGLLDAVSFGIYGTWEDHDSLRGQVYHRVRAIVGGLFGTDTRVSVRSDHVVITADTDDDRLALIERVRKAQPKTQTHGTQSSF